MAEEFSVLTDLKGCLSAVSDDARSIVGRADEEICAKPLFDLFHEQDQELVAETLRNASGTKNIKLPSVRLRTEGTHEARFDISVESGGQEKFYFFFTLADGEVVPVKPISKESFFNAIAERNAASGSPADQMVMVNFAGLRSAELLSRLGEDGVSELRTAIEQALADASADGQVGQLDESNYGVLGIIGADVAEIEEAVVAAAGALGVDAETLGMRVEGIALDSAETDSETLNKQLSHVCNKFHQTILSGGAFGLKQLSEAEAEIDEAVKFVEMALDRGDITVTSREVRQLQLGDVSFQLVRGALVFGNKKVPADRLLVLADHPELCARYDRAVVEAAVAAFPSATIVIDIGLPTLESGEAARIGAEYSLADKFIGFRPHGLDLTVKRSSAVREVDGLLKAGVIVWLMDFSTAIARSRQLRGAYVEVAASFLKDIISQPERNTLMSSLLKVWQEVEVNLVAVNLDTTDLRSFAHQLGVAYGVGKAADPTVDGP